MPATILCVHEDAALARVHRETLETEGYAVLCARDGRQAFEILRAHHLDFVVLDSYLPRQDGFEILAEMRTLEAHHATPVLLLSDGDVTDELSQRAMSLSAIGIESAPMSPARLIERVNSCAKEAAPSVELEGGAAKAALVGAEIPERGDLQSIPIPELLHGLRKSRCTGVLSIKHGKRKKAIELRDGWPVSVKSNLISECLGAYLVRVGRVSQEIFDESVVRMRAGEGLQGEILVAMDVLDEQAMVEALQEHALDKFFEIFGWRRGEYVIRSKAHVQRGSTLGLEGHPARLVIEGIRRTFPLKQIDRYFAAHHSDYVVPIGLDESEAGEIGLSDDERAFVAKLDGSMRVGVVLDEPEWVRRIVFGLITIEMLCVNGDAVNAEDARAHAAAFARDAMGGPSGEDESIRAELAELANRMRNRDHYGVLDVPSTATDEEVRIAFACLSKRTHPDRFHGASHSVRQLAEQVFARVVEAEAAISTVERREAYGRELALGVREDAVEEEGRRALQAETEFQKGEAKMAARDYEGALLNFGRAMENFPSEGEYRSHYGWCLYLCHPENDVMLGEALEHCREGVKLAKDREKPYLLLGRLYKAMGKAVAAKKMFSRAVQIKPQCVEAMRELRIMNMRRDKDKSIATTLATSLGKGVMKRVFRR